MANKRVDNIITGNYDRFTGVPFNTQIATTLPDGTVITDALVDNAVVFKNLPRNGGGYSVRSAYLENGEVNIEWFGAKGNGIDDDTEPFLKALESPLTLTLKGMETKEYLVTSPISITRPLSIANIKFKATGASNILEVLSDNFEITECELNLSEHSGQFINATNINNIRIYNNVIIGGFYGLFIDNCNNLKIENNTCQGSQRWSIYVNGGQDIIISHNTCSNGLYDGIKMAGYTEGAITTCKNILISDNICHSNGRDGIDCAMNNCDGLKVHNNILVNNKLHAIDIKVLNHETESFSLENVIITDNLCKNGLTTDSGEVLINVQRSGVPGEQLGRVFKNVIINNNQLITTSETLVQNGIRCFDVQIVNIEGNLLDCNTGTGPNGAIRVHFGSETYINSNKVLANASSILAIYIESLGYPVNTQGVKIYNNYLEASGLNVIRVIGGGVVGCQIYDNELKPDPSQYTLSDSGSDTIYYNNFRGFVEGNPAQRGRPGEYFIDNRSDVGTPSVWECIAQSSSGSIHWVGKNQKSFRTGAGNIEGVLVPYFTGEEVFDTSSLQWYKSRGVSVNHWVLLGNKTATTLLKGLVNQSTVVSDVAVGAVTTIEEANTAIQQLATTLNAKLAADRTSGQMQS